jgi:hypothetical protein
MVWKFWPNLTFQTEGVSVGYNLKTEANELPLTIGLGYLENKFDYGKFIRTGPDSPDPLGEYNVYEQFKSISFGASYDYLLRFNLGISFKMYKSKLSDYFVDNSFKESIATGTVFDLGLMVTTPITKLVFNDYKINLNTNSSLKPNFDFTLGYSLSNLGKEVVYIDPAQADPLPRMARLGYSFNFSLEISNTKVEKFSFIDYSFTAESDDILINRDTTGKFEYQNPFGDIKPVKHLIELKGDDYVIVHKGHILRLFETLTLVSGRFNGRSYGHRKSSGIGISSEGLFKLLNSAFDVPGLNYFTKHFVCEYYETIIFKESVLETRMNGIVLSYKGFFF